MKLSEVCLNIVDCPHSTAPDEGSGYALIRTPNIGKGRFNLEGVHRISEAAYKKRCARITPTVNDLILAREAPAGNVAIIKENMEQLALGQRTVLIRPNPEMVYPDYLVYYLLAPKQQNELLGRATGATVAHVNIPIINNLPISLPSLETQQKIAGILSAYDDLIENNRKQIKLLEEAAQKLYKEWFVKLNFPGHENTKIVDGVPEGWKKEKLGNLLPIVTGKKDANFGTKDGLYPFFTCSQEPIKAPSYSFDANAILLAGNGDLNVKIYRGKFEAYQRTYVLVPYQNEHLYICYRTIQDNLRKLIHGASGSTIKFITKGMIEDIDVLIPNNEIILKFNNYSEVVLTKMENLNNQIKLLQSARDKLLSKLMNGELITN